MWSVARPGPSGRAAAGRPPRAERRDRRLAATVRPVVGLDQFELDARLDRKAEHDALSRRDRERARLEPLLAALDLERVGRPVRSVANLRIGHHDGRLGARDRVAEGIAPRADEGHGEQRARAEPARVEDTLAAVAAVDHDVVVGHRSRRRDRQVSAARQVADLRVLGAAEQELGHVERGRAHLRRVGPVGGPSLRRIAAAADVDPDPPEQLVPPCHREMELALLVELVHDDAGPRRRRAVELRLAQEARVEDGVHAQSPMSASTTSSVSVTWMSRNSTGTNTGMRWPAGGTTAGATSVGSASSNGAFEARKSPTSVRIVFRNPRLTPSWLASQSLKSSPKSRIARTTSTSGPSSALIRSFAHPGSGPRMVSSAASIASSSRSPTMSAMSKRSTSIVIGSM